MISPAFSRGTLSTSLLCSVLVAGVALPASATTSPAAAAAGAATSSPTSPGVSDRAAVRVVGGQNANRAQTNWFLEFTPMLDGEQELCGATAISSRWAVTAAHCVTWPDGTKASTGTGKSYLQVNPPRRDSGKRFWLDKIVVNPNYRANSASQRNDLALLHTSIPMGAGKLVPNSTKSAPAKGTAEQVFGFGERISGDQGSISTYLQVGNVEDLGGPSQRACGLYTKAEFDPAYQLCSGLPAGGIDACQGDSGGPLIAKVGTATRLVGIVSTGTGCGLAKYPGIYTRVSTYASWINSYVHPARFKFVTHCTNHVCKVCKTKNKSVQIKNVSSKKGTWRITGSNKALRVSSSHGTLRGNRSTVVEFTTRTRVKKCVKVTFSGTSTKPVNYVFALNKKRGCTL